MGICTFRDGTHIYDYGSPYMVAEINSSHNGNMDTAKKLIDSAVLAGCDCVKFQSWSSESLYSKTYYTENPISKKIVKKFSLQPEQLKELASYCRKREIGFSSTPYSEEEVDFLIDECKVPYVKIASMEINNFRYLEYIGGKRIPVVLSTGMSDEYEIKNAISILEQAGVSDMVILHCVSTYPAKLTTINLNNIIGFREYFPQYPIGFSDHTEGDSAAVAAVALGASLIEKHLTLDKTKVGMDNGMATEPDDMKALVSKCRNVHLALGSKQRIISDAEYEQRTNMRRSITSAKDIKKGHIIEASDLYAKRPGTGFRPDQIKEIIGKRAKRDIEADTLILSEDIT